jgi:hypothetical protein
MVQINPLTMAGHDSLPPQAWRAIAQSLWLTDVEFGSRRLRRGPGGAPVAPYAAK